MYHHNGVDLDIKLVHPTTASGRHCCGFVVFVLFAAFAMIARFALFV
jgi:hypothetical protein